MIIKFKGNLLKNIQDAAQANDMEPREFIARSICLLLTLSSMDSEQSEPIFKAINPYGEELLARIKDDH